MFGTKKNKVYIVEFNGAVNQKVVKQFYKDMSDVQLKYKHGDGIIVRINCPGGSPALSEEVMSYIQNFNIEMPIIMYIEEMAASGGYYIASGIKTIVANKNAIVGSIGVIMQKYEISGLADKIGVAEDNLSVGEFKQPLSMFKPVDADGEKYLKDNLMNPMYKNFSETIAENRGIDINTLNEKYGEGRVFVASEVVGTLVDVLSTMTNLLNSNWRDHEAIFVNTKKKTYCNN